MQIQKVEIRNFKTIGDAKVDLMGRNVFLVAPNGKGKTSFIDACFGHMPQQPLKEGEKKGHVTIELDEYDIEFKFTQRSQKAKMNIFDKSGKPQTAPAKLFKELFGIQDFDIDAFLNKPASKQVDFIKDIIGIDWSDVDQEYKDLFEDRKYKKKQAAEIDGEIADRPFDPNMKPVDVSVLSEQMNTAIETNAKIDRVELGLVTRREKITHFESQITELKAKIAEIDGEIADGQNWLADKEKIDVSGLQQQISDAADHNASIAENTKIGELREKSGELWKEIDDVIQPKMDKIKELKKNELENAVMPVNGLEFDDDQLYLNGLPFNGDQINTAKRIIAGLELQFHMMNDVKIARLDGSLLDKKSMADVEKWAAERNIQLFVELVDRDGEELKIEVQQS